MTTSGFVRDRVGGFPRAFWALWTGTLVNRLGTMVEPYLAFYLAGVRHMPVTSVGLVLALLGAGSLLAQFVGGVLADRIGRRATLALGTGLTAAVMLVLGSVSSLPVLVVMVFLLGLTIDIYRPASSALLADLVSPADRPRAYGLLFWAINLGFAIAMVAGGTLARLGYGWLFRIDAVTGVVFGFLVWFAVPETRARVRHDQPAGSMLDVLRDRVMVAYVAIGVVYMFVYLQVNSTMSLAMRQQGLSPAGYGLAMAVNGIGIVIVQPLVLNRLQVHDRSRVLAAGCATVGLGFGALTFASSVPEYAAATVVWTLGEIMVFAVTTSVVADLAPAHLRGRYNGLWGVAWGAGSMLAPLLGSRLLAVGRPALWLTCLALCAAAAVGQLQLGPAIRRRSAAAHHPGAIGQPAPALTEAAQA
jgi:MFS family permease